LAIRVGQLTNRLDKSNYKRGKRKRDTHKDPQREKHAEDH